jgi:hypothetical protein
MPPPDERGRPLAAYQETGPSQVDAHASEHHSLIVRHGSDGRQHPARRRRPPRVYASVYEPCGRRTWWWIAYLCPWCGGGHLGRTRTEQQAAGPHRSGCGRMVLIVAARTYRARPASGAAA